ncbi:MAG: energy-coupling factor transporter transmembrane protein EcfT [Deltaproteobacteria bacterium]|nr:MAG: energy-coupling factor transporter transmembrane protein EcfT [Deltaproteobacteria bacterium]
MKFLRDLTLGHYYPTESAIHSLDPRVKLLGLFLSGITLFSLDRLWGLAMFFVAALWLIRFSHLPLTNVIRGLRPFGWLFLLTACLQLFFTSGQPILPFNLGPLAVTREGVYQAVRIGGQLALFILFSSILTLTTSPMELLRALEKFGGPLKRVRIPVADLCLAMLLCIRFLPILGQEAERIIEAQTARGIDLKSGTWRNRLEKFHGIFLPLLYNVLARAEELATAMAVRGYGQTVEKQTLKSMRLSKGDRLSLVVIVFWCITLFWFFRG